MGLRWGGRCAAFLVAALALDAAGLGLVLAGAVGHPRLEDGASFEDFLVLSGALLLFLSLLCWLFWYSGNLRGIPDPQEEEAPLRPPPSLLRLAAKLSQRLSQRQRPQQLRAPGPPALELSQRSPAGPQERLV